jgi:hypothetical protein
LKALRHRINKKINKNYNQRQKILSEIEMALDIDFNKIVCYSSEIIISPSPSKNYGINLETDSLDKITSNNLNDLDGINSANKNKENPLFQIQLSNSFAGSQRFYYKGIEINSLSMDELNNLKKNLDYILNDTEKEIDKLLI